MIILLCVQIYNNNILRTDLYLLQVSAAAASSENDINFLIFNRIITVLFFSVVNMA